MDSFSLDKQIIAMKAQHEYISNLQRANNSLKSKIKVLEEIVSNETANVTLDLDPMEIIPIA